MKLLRRVFSPLLGIFFGVILLLSSFIGDSVIIVSLPVLFLNCHHQWRVFIDRAISFWIIIPVTFLEYIFGVQFVITGDIIDYDRPAVVIMNHRTRLDWMYFWAALFKINPWLLISSKIALKAELRRLPAAGFGMEANHFIFLNREMKTDKERISEAIQYYASVGRNYQILLFPEGTDKTPGTTIKSNVYAKKNGLKELNNLIYPRSAGFIHLINEMRRRLFIKSLSCTTLHLIMITFISSDNYIECVYDVTIAYPVNIVQSEKSLILSGRTPKKVLFHIERIDLSCLPVKDNEIAQWINELWIAKDRKLDLLSSQQSPRVQFPNTENKFIWEEDCPLQKTVKLLTLCFWSFFIIIWLYHMTFLRFVQMLSGCFLFAYVYIQSKYGGIQRLVYAKWWHTMETKTVKSVQSCRSKEMQEKNTQLRCLHCEYQIN